MYSDGVIETRADLAQYSPPPAYAKRFFDPQAAKKLRAKYPDHCLFFGTHVGPFMGSYMAMGLDRFCLQIGSDPAFIHTLMESRTVWCKALFGRAVELGARAASSRSAS